MAIPDNPFDLHHYRRPDMDTFVVSYQGALQHERGATFVQGFFVTGALARAMQAADAELEDAKRRAGIENDSHAEEQLPAFENYMEVMAQVQDERATSLPHRGLEPDTIDVDTAWLHENVQVAGNRLVPGQIITPEQLAISGAHVAFAPRPDHY